MSLVLLTALTSQSDHNVAYTMTATTQRTGSRVNCDARAASARRAPRGAASLLLALLRSSVASTLATIRNAATAQRFCQGLRCTAVMPTRSTPLSSILAQPPTKPSPARAISESPCRVHAGFPLNGGKMPDFQLRFIWLQVPPFLRWGSTTAIAWLPSLGSRAFALQCGCWLWVHSARPRRGQA